LAGGAEEAAADEECFHASIKRFAGSIKKRKISAIPIY
jgi:hypothetical protein